MSSTQVAGATSAEAPEPPAVDMKLDIGVPTPWVTMAMIASLSAA